MSENQPRRPHPEGDQLSKAEQPAPPVHAIVDNPPSPKAEANSQQELSPEKPLPRFERPEWVIVYITAIYSAISGLTLWVIKRQANIMEGQAADARGSAAAAAVVAQRTLNAIERQVINMRRQVVWSKMSYRASKLNAEAAILSAKAASASVEAFKQRERARFFVVPFALFDVETTPSGLFADHYGKASVQLTHVGPTDALNVFGQVKTAVQPHDSPLPDMIEMEDVSLPTVIKSGHKPIKLSLPIRLADREAVDALKQGNTVLHFFGFISYDDAFGERHETRFRYIWRPQFFRMENGPEASNSQWETCGPPEDNQAT